MFGWFLGFFCAIFEETYFNNIGFLRIVFTRENILVLKTTIYIKKLLFLPLIFCKFLWMAQKIAGIARKKLGLIAYYLNVNGFCVNISKVNQFQLKLQNHCYFFTSVLYIPTLENVCPILWFKILYYQTIQLLLNKIDFFRYSIKVNQTLVLWCTVLCSHNFFVFKALLINWKEWLILYNKIKLKKKFSKSLLHFQ